jgi:DNA polymerase III subunit delta'
MSGYLPWHQAQWERVQAAIAAGRVAHAWLLNGPPETGKLVFALAMARALLCAAEEGPRPCDNCRSCHLSKTGAHPDHVHLTPPEGKREINVAAVREVLHQSALTRQFASYQTFIIEPLDSVGPAATNALLKTLEEPPPNTIFIAVTSRRSSILPTIVSRCQRIDMPLPPNRIALEWLRTQCAAEDPADFLDAAQGMPLRAVQLAETPDSLALRNGLRRDLANLMRHKSLPLEVAREWSKAPLEDVLAWMQGLSTGLIRRCLTDADATTRGLDVPKLYFILDQIVEARRSVAQRANLNATLMLESLALAWSDSMNEGR